MIKQPVNYLFHISIEDKYNETSTKNQRNAPTIFGQ